MHFLSKNSNSTSKPLLLHFYLLLYTLKSRKLFIQMAIRKIVLFIGTFFLFLVSSLSCEKQTTIVEDKPPVVTLTIEDIAVTEAWLNVKTEALCLVQILSGHARHNTGYRLRYHVFVRGVFGNKMRVYDLPRVDIDISLTRSKFPRHLFIIGGHK